MAIKIVTDSASDIPQALARQWDITVLPLTIRFGSDEYQDGVNLSLDRFYERLESGKDFPQTSQITPYTYGLAFRDAVAHGDDVVCLCMSSGVSGSFQSACFAAAEFDNHVFVIDTRQFCISEYIIVERTVRLRDAGLTAAEIAAVTLSEMPRAHVFAAFDTLEYLKRGGRLSGAAAPVGGLLNIKPVLTITDGAVDVLAKARGTRKACDMLVAEMVKLGEIDTSMPLLFGYTGNNDEAMRYFVQCFKAHFACPEVRIVRVGATIGAYAGPNAFAVAFYTKE